MSALQDLLATFRATAKTEREKGTYFERLVKAYLQNEPYYRDLYAGKVWLWEEWRTEAAKRGLGDVGSDAGIDLIAETTTGELYAIQAKFYEVDENLEDLHIPWLDVLRTLKQGGYEGWLSSEYEGRREPYRGSVMVRRQHAMFRRLEAEL